MSVSTGRMSRADAQAILTALQPAIQEFLSPDATDEIRAEAQGCAFHRAELQAALDSGSAPDATAIRILRARVAALQFDRLAHSDSLPPRTSRASVVTLYGISDNTVQCAADLAAQQLGLPSRDHVRLQDASHVRTATLTGTRYIFTSTAP